jgi:hypothetical protein
MKTEAYICDSCNELRLYEEVVGVSPAEDIFERIKSYPVINRPDRAEIHMCTPCFNKFVIDVATREHNRRTDEQGYTLKMIEMSYLLRSKCVTAYKNNLAKILARKK